LGEDHPHEREIPNEGKGRSAAALEGKVNPRPPENRGRGRG